jgi:hypothetical protein
MKSMGQQLVIISRSAALRDTLTLEQGWQNPKKIQGCDLGFLKTRD